MRKDAHRGRSPPLTLHQRLSSRHTQQKGRAGRAQEDWKGRNRLGGADSSVSEEIWVRCCSQLASNIGSQPAIFDGNYVISSFTQGKLEVTRLGRFGNLTLGMRKVELP